MCRCFRRSKRCAQVGGTVQNFVVPNDVHKPKALSNISSYQTLCTSRRHCPTFRNMSHCLLLAFLGHSPNPETGKPSLVSCSLLLIQHTGSCLPDVQAVSAIPNPRTRHAMAIGQHFQHQFHFLLQVKLKEGPGYEACSANSTNLHILYPEKGMEPSCRNDMTGKSRTWTITKL